MAPQLPCPATRARARAHPLPPPAAPPLSPPSPPPVILPRIFKAHDGAGAAQALTLAPAVLDLFRECERQGDSVSFAVLMAELAAGVLEGCGGRELLPCGWPYCDACYVALKAARQAAHKDVCARRDEVLAYLDRLEGSSGGGSSSRGAGSSSGSGSSSSSSSSPAAAFDGDVVDGSDDVAAEAAEATEAAEAAEAATATSAAEIAAEAPADGASSASLEQPLAALSPPPPPPPPPLQLQAQLQAALDAEEAALRAALAEAEAAQAGAAAALARARARRAALGALQRGLWTTQAEVARRLRSGREAMDALAVQCARQREALARLRCLRVHSDAFFIWHAEPYATINGARLGRVPGRGVPDWAEVNAALGQMALLLSLTAARLNYVFKRWRIIPMGSYSKVAKVEDERASMQELSYDASAFFSASRLSSALKPLMQCMGELGAHVEALEAERHGGGQGARQDFLPHPVSAGGERVGDLAVALGKDVPWTRAMRMAATNLKWLCAYAEKLEK